MNRIDEDLGDRIAALRFLMVAGIVLMHIPPGTLPGGVAPVIVWLDEISKGGLFRGGVPVLTAISGYLLFRSALDQAPLRLLRKKTGRLLVPLILWNLPLVVALYILQASGGLAFYEDRLELYPLRLWPLLQATIGLTDYPLNYPLHFLRDLFVLALLAPLFGVALRRAPWVGLVVVGVVFLGNLDGNLVLRNEMPVIYYVGGLAAIRTWDLRRLDGLAWPCLAAFLAGCVLLEFTEMQGLTAFRLLAPVLIWPAASRLTYSGLGVRCRALSDDAYFLFLSNVPAYMALWMLYNMAGRPVPYAVFFLLAPVVVITTCVSVHRALRQVSPGTERLVTGAV
jgi:succinoglycan biosynthesis protein ExoH